MLIAVGLAAVKAASQSAAASVVAIDVESDPVRSGLAASLENPDRLGFREAKTYSTLHENERER